MTFKRNKRVIFVTTLILFFILGNFLVNSSQEKIEKISKEVYEKLKNDDEVRVIIKLKEPSQKKGLLKIQKSTFEINLEKQKIKKNIIKEIGKENIKHVFGDYFSAQISKKELDKLKNHPNIESIVPTKKIIAFLQDSVPLINASEVWPIQLSGINITGVDETVCVLDTGINFSHPDLIGKNKTCTIDCITNVNCVENCSISDDNGHGTHVAGIIAASGGINGVAINVGLIGVKVLDSNGNGQSDDLELGIDWCIANADKYNISVISMSLGADCLTHPEDCYDSYCDSAGATLTTIINNATSHNISVIAATGNEGNTTAIPLPACIENVTSVAATDKNDNIASYSNRNNITDLVAPGSDINSTIIPNPSEDILDYCGTGKSYCSLSGTSMAAPHVAGAFVLIRQFFRLQNGRVPTPSEIEDVLNDTGTLIDDSSGSGYNFPRIDVYSALLVMEQTNLLKM